MESALHLSTAFTFPLSFSNLDDVCIRQVYVSKPGPNIPDTALVSVSAPKLRRQLALHCSFFWAET